MGLYERILIERQIAPNPMRGEDPILMKISREIEDGKRAMPASPIASTVRKSYLAAMKAEACE